MKNIYLLLILLISTVFSFAQTPNQFKYQAVLRNAEGTILANENVNVDISILQGSTSGTEVFTESHSVTTTEQGLINLNIGSFFDLSIVDWAGDIYFIEISVNGTVMGTSQLLSVPYALHAKTVENDQINDADFDPENELQDLSLTNNTLSIENGNSVDIGLYLDNTDNQNLNFNGTTLEISGGTSVDLSSLQDGTGTDDQTLSEVLNQNNSAENTNITNLADPLNDQDAVTKAYVDVLLLIIENNGLNIVDFSSDVQTIIANLPVIFTENSTINPTAWQWNFGDGNMSTEQHPTHIYLTEGTYTVSLTVNSGTFTKTETKTDYITVEQSVTDYDNNTYAVVIIGNQEWMAENLKTTHYADGIPIPLVTDNSAWGNLGDNNIDDAYCYVNNNVDNEYGILYTWAAAMGDNAVSSNSNPSGVQGVCPNGWHLPSDSERAELTDYLGGDLDAGGKLKETGTTHWNSPNTGATNESNFTALPGGYRDNAGGSFVFVNRYGLWWSATQYNETNAKYHRLTYDHVNINTGANQKSTGCSVRCVKN